MRSVVWLAANIYSAIMVQNSNCLGNADGHQAAREMPRPAVLVLDDEEYVAEELSCALRRFGFDIFATTVPADAIRIIDMRPEICVLVSDIRMPSLDGFDLMKRLDLPREGEGALEVVLMTGHGTKEDIEQARQVGAFGVLHKPFKISEAIELVSRAVSQALQKRTAPAL